MRTAAFVLLLFVACSGDEEEEASVNRLAKEKSVYLRQHATNPVDWYPWGKEAFEKAKREDRPIFLSIGYSSCHWCHVMEHESFADEEVAEVLNKHFVSIKVDREERPDVDTIYMNAVQLMRVQGGWPLSVWMTPDLKPFFGGTYFPKTAGRGMPGFIDVLEKIAAAWRDPKQREQIAASGDRVQEILGEVMAGEEPETIGDDVLKDARASSELGWDRELGGFGGPPAYAPKFPSPSSVEMLLRHALRFDDKEALAHVTKTLDRMALGGIHDHVGGGFHRYSTTRDWLVPHFEKMLYDNGQLLGLYAWAYLATRKELYRETAADIARWVAREMTHENGGFYSAQDADDPGGPEGEGGFYVWDPKEIGALFAGADEAVALAWFDITEDGNWPHKPGKSLLQRRRSAAEVAKAAGVEEAEVPGIVARITKRMYEVREKRPKPITDPKVITGWNGLMISGYARAYQAFGEQAYLDAATKCGRFLRSELTKDGRLLRRWAEGEAAFDGVLDDYAYVAAAFLDLYESTFDREWLEEAMRLVDLATELFYDEKDGGFFYTAEGGEDLIARGKPGFDNARPSGNGVMALNLLRIAELTAADEPRRRAVKTLEYFGGRLAQGALGFGQILNTIDFLRSGPREIFVAGAKDDPATRALIEAIWRNPDGNRVVALATPGIEELLPPAAGKTPVDGKPAAYVCRNFTCDAPVTDPAALAK